MAECTLVIHGGNTYVVEADYAEEASWFSQTASRIDARQYKLANEARLIIVSSSQIVALIGDK
jgi:hypothetical protein